MNSYGYSSFKCGSIVDNLTRLRDSNKEFSKYISSYDIFHLIFSCEMERVMEYNDGVGKPMVWIGIYIAIASLFCVLAMAADLLHGYRNKKFWFPCKYFSLNAASITVITVAMKLPVDLSTSMPSYIDQATKLGSLGFMCTMMANLMPSLASMDNNTLLANVIGLSILVITVVVNILIQINTSIIFHLPLYFRNIYICGFVMIAYAYTAMTLALLIVMISSSLTIPSSKKILDTKYQVTNRRASSNQSLRHIQMSIVDKLRQHVRRHWVMAETSNPQFVMASNPLSTASGIICVLSLLMSSFLALESLRESEWSLTAYASSYKWSTIAVLLTQFIGVVVGTIAPIFRCFSVFSFKLVVKWNMNNFMCFKVEKYWTQKLHEWKESPIPYLSSSPTSRSLICNSKNMILSLCIIFQKVIVISCKVLWFIVALVPLFVVSCLQSWNLFKAASGTEDIDEDLNNYVLQIDNEMELAEKTLKGILNSMNSFILKSAKDQNNNLLELLKKSTGFKGVEMFDTDHVQPLSLSDILVNGWSLPIVTLTCIAVALPSVHKDTVESLIDSVGEGLSYTHLVEESLNCASEYVTIRKVSMSLWNEVENKRKWLDNPLAKNVFKGDTTTEILKWFSDIAKQLVTEYKENTVGELVENPPHTLIAANSMWRITQTILLRYQSNVELITDKELFDFLSSMIADIFSACFTNIPRVITMRCHESAIEKREASVKVAAQLLGKTMKIIEKLETRELPNMDDDKMAYIDEWRLYLKQSFP